MVNVPLELLKLYFQLGLHYKEIVWILAHNHGIIISLRHLKRKLRELGLYRRKQWTNYCEVVAFLKKELQASGQLHGYRMMHAKCISKKGRCEINIVTVGSCWSSVKTKR